MRRRPRSLQSLKYKLTNPDIEVLGIIIKAESFGAVTVSDIKLDTSRVLIYFVLTQ